MQRDLDRFEKLFLHRYPVFSTNFTGTIDPEVFRHAFEQLGKAHRILRSTVIKHASGYSLNLSENHRPCVTMLIGDESELWRDVRKHRMHHTRDLSRLIIRQGDNEGAIALQVCHSFFDGPALLAMLAELWSVYSALLKGSPGNCGVRSVYPPRSIDNVIGRLLDENDMVLQDTLAREQIAHPLDELDGEYRIGADNAGQFPIHRYSRLTREETTALLRAAKKASASMHAVVSGSILVALRGRESPRESYQMACTSTVNVRNRVTPPIAPTEAGMYALNQTSDIKVTADANPIEVGIEIKKKLDADLEKRFSNARARDAARSTNGGVERSFSATVGNAGVVPSFVTPDDVNVTDVQLMPEILINPYLGADLEREFSPFLHAYTFDGRLTIDGRFPADLFNSAEADELVESYLRHLRTVAADAA